MSLHIRIEPSKGNATEHARKMIFRQMMERTSWAPIIPARDSALIMSACEECDEPLWRTAYGGHPSRCEVCKAKNETMRSSFIGQIMDHFSGE